MPKCARDSKPLIVGLRTSTICGYSADMMITALQFADAVGRKKMADALKVGATAVSNAVVSNSFPSSWFLVCQSLALEAGVSCPPCLFKMKEQDDNTQIVDCPQHLQGGVA